MRYIVDNISIIPLGKQGENLARELEFPELPAWVEEFGSGTAELFYLQPGTVSPQAVPLSFESGAWIWRPTAAELARAGYGRCELRYTVGSTVVKSSTYATYVSASLGEDGETPVVGGDKFYIYVQPYASDRWRIRHGLGKMPSVTVVDSAGTVVVGDVRYISDNEVEVGFSSAFSGKAYLN